MNSIIVLGERLFEEISPQPVDLSESFTDEAVKFGVCLLL